MDNKKFIAYLNSLHNYNAQNSNAYGEKNVGNEFFQEVAVEVGLCAYIEKQLLEEEPHVLILTGHAGDGKTSIMYQVLKKFGVEFNTSEKISEIVLPNKKKCQCIKDFSELSDDEKLSILKKCITLPEKGEYVFVVSNTGPLINTFGDLFESDRRETAKIALIDAMDENSGEIKEIEGYKVGVINVASVDNTGFAVEFIKNIIKDSLWSKCSTCEKCSYCHIYKNTNLIRLNQQMVLEFIKRHYIWMVEHGIRLTIRSMTEQLAYMITGGVECENIIPIEEHKMLFFNLFFGYIGLKNNKRADTILAVREAKKCAYDKKRLRADEKLIIDCDYTVSVGNDIANILIEAQKKDRYVSGWVEFLRRAYIFTNIETDKEKKDRDTEDIFSKQFERYLELRDGNSEPTRNDTNLIIDALSKMYIGKVAEGNLNEIPITLNKSSGLTQNVQLVTGVINTRRMSLVRKKTKDSRFDKNHERYELHLKVDKEELDSIISLPMLNYFEELRNGIISTNIDPQLSHGVESLKAQIARKCNDDDDEIIELNVLRNDGVVDYKLEITEENEIRCI